jgi:hypothetical protein
MPNLRIAVNMQPQRDASGQEFFRATLPMGVLFERTLDKQEVERARAALEGDYRALVENLRATRGHLRDGNVLRYWMLGDAIVAFETQTARALVFVDKLSDHLARDVNYSRTMIDLCRRFRIKLPDKSQIDPQLSFDADHRSGFDPKRAAAYERAKGPKRPRGRPRKN